MLDWLKLTPAVKRAAKLASSSFPEHHNVSDVEQTLWVWVMENKPTIIRILSDSKGSTVPVDRLLLKAATTYLRSEDAAVYGYEESDKFYYSTDLIKKILEVVFHHEDWQSFATSLDAMPRSKKDPATAGNNLAAYADVKSAVERLPEDQYNAVVWRYKYSYTFAQVGEAMGFTRQRAQQVLEGAVRAIQRILGEKPLSELRNGHSGRTEPSSNASAQARVEQDYEG